MVIKDILRLQLTLNHCCNYRRNKEQRMRVTNKARVEGSIVEATIAKEIGTFSARYFAERSNISQEGVGTSNRLTRQLSIFDTPGRTIGKGKRKPLDDKDWDAAHTYVILNCPEICEKYMGYNLINIFLLFSKVSILKPIEISCLDIF